MNAIEELEKIAAQITKRRNDYISEAFFLTVRALTIAEMMEAQNPEYFTELGLDKEIENIRKKVELFRKSGL